MLSFKDMINGRRSNKPATNKKQKNVPKVVKKPEPVKKQESTEKIVYKTVKEIQEVPVEKIVEVEKVVEKVVEVPESTTLDSLPFVIGTQVELVHNLNKKNKQIGVVVGYNHETRKCEIQLDGARLKTKIKKEKLGFVSDEDLTKLSKPTYRINTNKKPIIQNNLNENKLLKKKKKEEKKEENNSTIIIKKKKSNKEKIIQKTNKDVPIKQNKRTLLLT